MPPGAAAVEGQKSIMSFFRKVDAKSASPPSHASSKAGECPSTGALDASAASAAATPPPSALNKKAPAVSLLEPGSAISAQPVVVQSKDSSGVKKKCAKPTHRKSKRGSAEASSRPLRASKSRAQKQLKERDYSSDSLMEESEK